jgi:competence protein ComEC
MGGFALARALPPGCGGGWWLVGAAVGAGVAALGAWREGWAARLCWGAGLVVAVLGAAAAYFQYREHHLAVWERLPAREAELVLEVERVFPSSPGRVTTTGLARIALAPELVKETVGQRVYFSVQVPAGGEILASARVRALGVLNPLARRPAGGFDSYLASSGASFKFNRARWLAQERGPGPYQRMCARAAKRFERILSAGLADRPALRSIHVAMMLGSKAELSEEQRELFMNSGTMHLFAISGLHIAVIWAALAGLMAALRVPRLAGIAAGLLALLLYVEITGGAPSAMRAWWMIALVLVAEAMRWTRNPLAGITASALVVLWWEPWQLFGASFQLSYGVVASLLLYGLVLDERLQKRWNPWVALPEPHWRWWHHSALWVGREAISGFALAVAATLVSLPMTVALFGLFTPGSLLVNLVCVPISALSIVAGFGSLLAGLVGLEPVSVLFNHASVLVILAMERGLRVFMMLPAMHWPAQFRAEWLGAAVVVALLAALAAGYALRWRRVVGGLWAPLALLAVLLAVAVHHGAAPTGPVAGNLPAAAPPAIAPHP